MDTFLLPVLAIILPVLTTLWQTHVSDTGRVRLRRYRKREKLVKAREQIVRDAAEPTRAMMDIMSRGAKAMRFAVIYFALLTITYPWVARLLYPNSAFSATGNLTVNFIGFLLVLGVLAQQVIRLIREVTHPEETLKNLDRQIKDLDIMTEAKPSA